MNISKYIGQGSYGCAIKPGFNCSSTNEILDNTVSKLFSNEKDYKDEVEIYKKVIAIDKDNKFTLKLISHCEIKSSYINENVTDIGNCDIIRYKPKIYQIVYEYGGIDLNKLFVYNHIITKYPNLDIYDFLKKFIEIFKGLDILSNHGLVHRDIKIDNILFNGNKIFLIDFGLLTNVDMIYKDNNPEIYYHNNPFYYPSELFLFSALLLNKNIPSYRRPYVEEFLNIINNYIKKNKSKLQLNPDYLNEIQKLNKYLSLRANAYFSYFKKNYDFIDFNQLNMININRKIDTYQLGIVIYEIIITMMIIYSSEEIKKIPIGIFQLLKEILEPDPIKRLDITEILPRYSKLFS